MSNRLAPLCVALVALACVSPVTFRGKAAATLTADDRVTLSMTPLIHGRQAPNLGVTSTEPLAVYDRHYWEILPLGVGHASGRAR